MSLIRKVSSLQISDEEHYFTIRMITKVTVSFYALTTFEVNSPYLVKLNNTFRLIQFFLITGKLRVLKNIIMKKMSLSSNVQIV